MQGQLKNYIAFSRDHSGSMSHITKNAALDYNNNIAVIKEEAQANNIDTIVSVMKCGAGRPAKNKWESVNSNVQVLQSLAENAYIADGNATPLFDSIATIIDTLEAVPDAADPMVSFLVMAITDGGDNDSDITGRQLGERIKKLQATDRWTFVFRVPVGESRHLAALGIPAGNIQEWDTTSARGMDTSSAQTAQAFKAFYAARATGQTSTKTFYANLNEVTKEEIEANLTDISSEVSIWPVSTKDDGKQIQEFVEAKTKKAMIKGTAFYQLTKPEKAVQDYKLIAIRDQNTGAVYSGPVARDMLGLPRHGDVRLKPGDHSNYDVFIQSTSVNRKLTAGSSLLHWPKATLSK